MIQKIVLIHCIFWKLNQITIIFKMVQKKRAFFKIFFNSSFLVVVLKLKRTDRCWSFLRNNYS